jgi:DUF971 family protein
MNPMNSSPTNLRLTDAGRLQITWSDGEIREYTPRELREACPCATCREKRNAPPPPMTELPVLSPQEARPLSVASMKPVGNYAYGVGFSDGHNTGIYTLETLRELGQTVPSNG